MQKIDFKKKIIDKCIDTVKKSIELSEREMKEAQDNANEYGGPKDRYDPYRDQQMSKKEMYGNQLAKYIEELRALEKIDPEEVFKTAEFGSVVITNAQKLFISVAAGKLEVEKEVFFAVSINSPIGQALSGKNVNEKFTVNNKEFVIQEIY